MLSKSVRRARMPLVMLLFVSCSSMMPWKKAPPADEVNLAFNLRNYLLFLPSARINGKSGRFFFGSATLRTVIDPRALGQSKSYTFELGDRESLSVSPLFLDLGNTGDAI